MPAIFAQPRTWVAQPTGAPYPGAKLFFYQAGTLVQQSVYQDSGLVTAHPQPVPALDDGKFPVIYLNPDATADYRIQIRSSSDVLLDDLDNIPRTPVSFTSNQLATVLNYFKRTQLEIDNGITPVDYSYKSSPKRYGAVGDRVTDDLVPLTQWALAAGPHKELDAWYRCSDRLTFPLLTAISGIGSDLCGLDFTGATGTFTGNRCVDFSQGSLTTLPALAGDVAKGEVSLSITAHGLADGDLVRLYSSTTWNAALSTFTKGEYVKVLEVVDANTISITRPLDDAYTAASTTVSKFVPCIPKLNGFSIEGVSADSPVLGLYVENAAYIRIDDVKVRKSALTASTFRHCYDVETHGFLCEQGYEGTESGTQQYGVSWIHCQDVRGQGSFQGQRHGWTTGSTTGGGVVNRRVVCQDSVCQSSIDMACDNHGNSEYCGFENVTAIGGVALGGDHGFFHGRSFGHVDIQQGQVLRFRELLGTNFDVDIEGYTIADPSTGTPGTTGVIDLGRDGSSLSATTTRGGTLKLKGSVDAPNSLIGIRLINNGSTSLCNVIVDMDLQINASTTSANGLMRVDANTGVDFYSVDIRRLSGTQGLARSRTNWDVQTVLGEYLPFKTYTPVLAFGGSSTGITYATSGQVGWYQVNGNEVMGGGRIKLTSKGAQTGNVTVSTPLQALNQTGANFPVPLALDVVTFADTPIGLILAGTSTFQLYETANGGTRTSLTNSDFADTSEVYFTFSYFQQPV